MCPLVFSNNTAFPVTVFAVALFAGFGSACDSGQVVDARLVGYFTDLFRLASDPKSAPVVVFAPTTGRGHHRPFNGGMGDHAFTSDTCSSDVCDIIKERQSQAQRHSLT